MHFRFTLSSPKFLITCQIVILISHTILISDFDKSYNTNKMKESAPKTPIWIIWKRTKITIWHEISVKNGVQQKCIFKVNQKRDLISFKHFTAPKIKTPGTSVARLAQSNCSWKGIELSLLKPKTVFRDRQ